MQYLFETGRIQGLEIVEKFACWDLQVVADAKAVLFLGGPLTVHPPAYRSPVKDLLLELPDEVPPNKLFQVCALFRNIVCHTTALVGIVSEPWAYVIVSLRPMCCEHVVFDSFPCSSVLVTKGPVITFVLFFLLVTWVALTVISATSGNALTLPSIVRQRAGAPGTSPDVVKKSAFLELSHCCRSWEPH